MYSIFWGLIDSTSNRFSRILVFLMLVMGGVIFSLPRLNAWFVYSLIVYPILTLALLAVIKRLLAFLPTIKESCIALVKDRIGRQKLDAWWMTLSHRKHWSLCLAIAVFLAGLSLLFNRNQAWTRYLEALGFLYIGFIVGEIVYLLLLVPDGISQLKNFQLVLNPILPVNTVNLQRLAKSTFNLALSLGVSLLALNLVVATASLIFPHLLLGIILISVISWISMIGLSVYPHLILHGIVQEQNQKILLFLEDKVQEQYEDFKGKSKVASVLNEIIKMQEQVLGSRTFPISNNSIYGMGATMVFNVLPVIIGIIIK